MQYSVNTYKLNTDTQNNIAEIYDKYDYQLTPKKILVRIVLILLVTLVVLVTLYCGLFVIEFEKVPSKSISVSDVNLLSSNILSFQLKSTDYSLNGSCNCEINEDGIMYFTVYKPILQKRILQKQIKAELLTKKYDLDIRGVLAVYYIGYNTHDKVLIWENE